MENNNTFAASGPQVVTPSVPPQNPVQVSGAQTSFSDQSATKTVQELSTNPTQQAYTLDDLESPATANIDTPRVNPAANSVDARQQSPIVDPNINQEPPRKKFIKRILIGAGIVGVLIFIATLAVVFITQNQEAPNVDPTSNIPEQRVDLTVGQAKGVFDLAIEGQENKLIVNGSLVSRGDIILTADNDGAYGQISAQNVAGVYTYLLPNAAGTFCLDSNNCNYLTETDVTTTLVNNASGAVTIQGTESQITVTNNGNTVTLATPQNIATTSSPTFANLTVTGAATQDGNELCDNSNNCGFVGAADGFVQNGNSFGEIAVLGTNDAQSLVFETGGNAQMTIAAGGAVSFQNSTDSTNAFSVVNAAGSANVLQVDTINEYMNVSGTIDVGNLNTSGYDQCTILVAVEDCNASISAESAYEEETTDSYGIHNLLGLIANVTPNTSSSAGIYNQVITLGTQDFTDLRGIDNNVSSFSTGSINSITGINNDVTVSAVGGLTGDQVGIRNTVTANKSTFFLQGMTTNVITGPTQNYGEVIGSVVNISNSGSSGTAIGLRVSMTNTATGAINNQYGILIQAPADASGNIVTNNYGLYVEDQSAVGSTDAFNIYSAGEDSQNYFEGNIAVGAATGAYRLHVGEDVAGFAASFDNVGNNANRSGIRIQAGADDASGTTYYLDAYDGDGTQVGYIANTSGTFAVTDISDVRTKTNINDTDINADEILNGLRVVDFNRLQNPDGPLITGFIAQEVQDVYGQAVTEAANGYLGISKDAFIPVLVKGHQSQDTKITGLSDRITQLEIGLASQQSASTTQTVNTSGPTTLSKLEVTGSASVQGDLAVTGDTTFEGNIAVEGHIIGNEDTRGVVTIPAGETEMEHEFKAPYKDGSKPNIILTATNTFAPNYRVESDKDGFTVFFEAPAASNVKLNYQVQQ